MNVNHYTLQKYVYFHKYLWYCANFSFILKTRILSNFHSYNYTRNFFSKLLENALRKSAIISLI